MWELITKPWHSPKSSSFSSRWDSLLSRRSCLSISLCILILSTSSADRQHSSIVIHVYDLFPVKLRHSWRGLVKWMDSDLFRTLQGNFCPGTGGLVTFCRHSSSCRIQFRCISHSWCAEEAGGWAGSDWKAVWVYVDNSCVSTYSSILPWAAESETLAPQWARVQDRAANFSAATTTRLFSQT